MAFSTEFRLALEDWKRATAKLSSVWQNGGAAPDVFGDTYPSYLPSFDEFSSDVTDMDPYRKPKPNLPALPAVGSIVRARYDLDMGGHGTWQRGWTGEIVDINEDSQDAVIRAHRYLGPGLHEWDNARVLSLDDAMCIYENKFDRQAADDDQPMSGVLAFGILHEFEVIG